MTGSLRIALTAVALLMPLPAMAAELSPWLGSADQTPYQLDPHTMVAVTFASDPLQTGSLSKVVCDPLSCTATPTSANRAPAVGGAPQK
jgi:hypothetical protein